MVKYKHFIFIALIVFFLAFSFYPTYFELRNKGKLADSAHREFILEHNYYWPDYNLYLSKIRQGMEGRLLAIERYTSEPHEGSLIQIFYVSLGKLGLLFGQPPNAVYLAGRVIFSILLLLVVVLLVNHYFASLFWRLGGFLFVFVSGSFPFYYIENGVQKIGRYMEWWSNIDALQRITFIPHILTGQVLSFFLLLQITKNIHHITENKKQFIFYSLLGNILGLVFPPSLMTLLTTFTLISVIDVFKRSKNSGFKTLFISRSAICYLLFIICSLPSLFYTLAITQYEPWATLVSLHRNNHFIIPFGQFILATGPIFYLGLAGILVGALKKDKKMFPLIYWCLSTFIFLIFYTYVKDQSPLRFTQTGLFIPLGLLGMYFLYTLWCFIQRIRGKASGIRYFLSFCYLLFVICYLSGSLFMMKNSLDWQISWITQRLGATVPLVPYPPQAMYPLKDWMAAIRWLNGNTPSDSVVLSEVTAGNYIPAYSHNKVYFGQANTVQYDRKQKEATEFFSGKMSESQAKNLFSRGRIKYIFVSVQEQSDANGKNLKEWYPGLVEVYKNTIVTIYQTYID